MLKTTLLSLALSCAIFSVSLAQADVLPCEEALKNLRELQATSKADDAVKAEAAKLETKGIERCNADDDKRADEFFAQAIRLLAK